jgi:hypothetical protein
MTFSFVSCLSRFVLSGFHRLFQSCRLHLPPIYSGSWRCFVIHCRLRGLGNKIALEVVSLIRSSVERNSRDVLNYGDSERFEQLGLPNLMCWPTESEHDILAVSFARMPRFVLLICLGSKCTASTNSEKFVVAIHLGSQTYPSLEPAGLWGPRTAADSGSIGHTSGLFGR